MTDLSSFPEVVRAYFQFLRIEFDFPEPSINSGGGYYSILEYINSQWVIQIAVENPDDLISVTLASTASKDNPISVSRYAGGIIQNLGKEILQSNNLYFKKLSATTPIERELLKAAKEVRLFLYNT